MIYSRGQRPLCLHPGVLAVPRPLRVGGGGPGLLLVRGIPAVRPPGTGDIIHYYIIIIIINIYHHYYDAGCQVRSDVGGGLREVVLLLLAGERLSAQVPTLQR